MVPTRHSPFRVRRRSLPCSTRFARAGSCRPERSFTFSPFFPFCSSLSPIVAVWLLELLLHLELALRGARPEHLLDRIAREEALLAPEGRGGGRAHCGSARVG